MAPRIIRSAIRRIAGHLSFDTAIQIPKFRWTLGVGAGLMDFLLASRPSLALGYIGVPRGIGSTPNE